ncbi:hypothetical protein DENSPDRAFT_848382 [Dentipellis sp. KUC8613]|nr:hypothetical protein DENSPDRAFT_848382 [Dentipellis sp. KUC8613]
MPSLDRPSSAPRSHSRHRSHSDPFNDPLYTVPPPPPPKHHHHHRSSSRNNPRPHTASTPRTRDHSRDRTMEAVKDTVIFRNADLPSRTRPSRSQTSAVPAHTTSSHSRPAPATRRSHSEDSVPQHPPADKGRSSGRTKTPKKGSAHADVIDRLDFSGMGPMFHHDGPFDACAPSRNRHRTKAPMYAWTGINAEDEQAAAKLRDQDYDSPYPSPEVAKALPNNPYYPEAPKKQVDAIAEAWGIHEPEPYEEFFAGGGKPGEGDASAANSIHARETRNGRRGRDGRRGESDEATGNGRSRPTRRPTIPPPQPIFVGDVTSPEAETWPTSPPPDGSSPGGGVRRNKSLMQRIRKMRNAPNVPVGYEDLAGPTAPGAQHSPTSSVDSTSPGGGGNTRPTHRAQNSFLGRFGRGGRDNVSPTSEAYVYVEDPKMKDLPATPEGAGVGRTQSHDTDRGYFDAQYTGAGLGRKTSLLKKVKGVMTGK